VDEFSFKKSRLFCEDVAIEKIARRAGTPVYVYSLGTILGHFRKLKQAFEGLDHLICFSMKANSNLAILAALAREGCGFDIVSGGELFRLKKAGADMKKVIFAGVGKSADEIRMAVKAGIYMFNIESWPEAEQIEEVAAAMGKKVRVDFRLNPNVDAHTHAYITTGKSENKFGMPMEQAPALFQKARALKHLQVSGIHLHIGSQITEVEPYLKALNKATATIRELRGMGHTVQTLNLGGGLGIVYDKEEPSTAAEFARAVAPLLSDLKVKLILEPGRFIVGNAGILVTKVLYLKEASRKTFVVVDSAMNDLIRPSLYDAFHAIVPVKQDGNRGEVKLVDVVGPVCESGDFLAKDRKMMLPQAGDLLAIRSTGAYGFVMASNYNTRPRAAEILVDGPDWTTVRRRETLADLVRGESIPAALRK
jgi:diaminopimelate decarboxylase